MANELAAEGCKFFLYFNSNKLNGEPMPCGRKRKKRKIATHKRKKRRRRDRHKKKLR
jgi:hypothetical protein